MKIDQVSAVKNGLDRYFDTVINLAKNDKEFFILLADYWAYLVRNDEIISKVAEDITDLRNKATKLLENLELKAVKAIEVAYEKILKDLRKKKIDSAEIKRLQEEFSGYKTGRILSSSQLSDSYNRILTSLIMHLRDTGHKELVKGHIIESEEEPGVIKEFLLPEEFIDKTQRLFELDEIERKGLWKAWNNLIVLYLAYFQGYKYADEVAKDPKRSWEAMNFRGIVSELESIVGEDQEKKIIVFFERELFRIYLIRVHTYLITKLSLLEDGIKRNSSTKEGVTSKAIVPSKKVFSIEIYKEKLRYCILINGEFSIESKIKNPEENKVRYWDYLYTIATSESKTAYVDVALKGGVLGYFNSDRENPLYKSTGLSTSRILAYRSDYFNAGDATIEKMKKQKYQKLFKRR
jgi:hypothetical protein